MIREERLLKVLRAPHVSEKASTAMEKTNTIVLKVAKDATKAEIKAAAAEPPTEHTASGLRQSDAGFPGG